MERLEVGVPSGAGDDMPIVIQNTFYHVQSSSLEEMKSCVQILLTWKMEF